MTKEISVPIADFDSVETAQLEALAFAMNITVDVYISMVVTEKLDQITQSLIDPLEQGLLGNNTGTIEDIH